jgi:hypothetical protein
MRHRQLTTAAARPSLQQAARTAGFRSVERVRVLVSGGRSVAEVTGVLHRYPQTVPVSMLTAIRLAAAGASLDIQSSDPGSARA